MSWRTFALTVLAPTLNFALPAHAGQGCEVHRPSVREVEQALDLAVRTLAALDSQDARVVLIARAGQDLSDYGLHYSHLGFAYRPSGNGAWRILHKLNECGTDRAALYRQGLADFFMDQPWRYEAAIIPLAPQLQQALLPVLGDNGASQRLHSARYSMVAHPWGTRYQQSNQWALETLAAAASPTVAGRRDAQDWLRAAGYRPTTLHIPASKRLGARLTAPHIAFDDHPPGPRLAGRIDTVTVDSVFEFMQARGLGKAGFVVQ